MPEKAAAKANLLGSAINNWLKIAGIVLFIIGGAYLTYYQIQSNTAKNVAQDAKDIALQEALEREIHIWGDRSDKRYKRAMNEAENLKKDNKELEQELEETKIDIAFIKGRMYEQDKNR
jgi:peptidoglycan hydrolase CwlO-like protein